MSDPFADAQAWYDHAQKHLAEYRTLTNNDEKWTLHSARRDGKMIYGLRFDRDFLVRLKPVACEVANAFFQSLDNIVGAAARQAGVKRTLQIAWPWAIEANPEGRLGSYESTIAVARKGQGGTGRCCAGQMVTFMLPE